MERETPDGTPEVIQGLRDFQEHLGGELRVTLPDGIGAKQEVTRMDLSILLDAIAFLKDHP
jgi:3-dehydroquinate synthase